MRPHTEGITMATFRQYETKKGKRWLFKHYIGTNKETGKRQSILRRGFSTKKEANLALSRLLLEIEQGGLKKNTQYKYHEVATMWLEQYKNIVKESTYAKTLFYFEKHILPVFGNLYINNITASSEMIDLPLYGDVAAGALAEMESVDVWDVENIQLPKVILPALSSYTNLFAIRVNGDSMDKVIPDNSLVVVKACEDYVYKDGDIVVFSYNGEYSLKRYRPNAMKGFILFEADSHNTDFQDIPINKDDMPEARIYGKVIFYGVTPTN